MFFVMSFFVCLDFRLMEVYKICVCNKGNCKMCFVWVSYSCLIMWIDSSCQPGNVSEMGHCHIESVNKL